MAVTRRSWPQPDHPHLAARQQAGHQVAERLVAVALQAGAGAAQPRHALDHDAAVRAELDAGAHALQEQRQLEDLGLGRRPPDDRFALGQGRRQQRRLGGPHARVGQLDDGAPQATAAGRDALVGHLHLGAQGAQGVDVEVHRPAPELVAADSRHERLAGEVQERAEQQHRDAVEPAEGQRHRRIDLCGRR